MQSDAATPICTICPSNFLEKTSWRSFPEYNNRLCPLLTSATLILAHKGSPPHGLGPASLYKGTQVVKVMSGRRDSLSPPDREGTKDPGAHELGEDRSTRPSCSILTLYATSQIPPSLKTTSPMPSPLLVVRPPLRFPSFGWRRSAQSLRTVKCQGRRRTR